MPELPEVETIRRGLAKSLVGHKIAAVEVLAPKLFIGDPQMIVGQEVLEVSRRAKILIIKLSENFLLTHLKMTGQLIFQPNSGELVIGGHPDKAYGLQLPHKHSHVIIEFDNGTLFFNDLRKFGWLKVVRNLDDLKTEVAKFGPEYTWPEFTIDYFRAGILKRRITIKQTLLDQTFIAGIGNIYADESLFSAEINPLRTANELTETEAKKLFVGISEVFNLALQHGGTSSRDYRQADGSLGTYLEVAKVYKREGQPCLVCAQPIERIKIAGRSAHFCPNCQK
ncbi:MAG: bifunctional DNA-formamidopyrimidine glycosylase/DNA-(apurinic or apyrimidinic site) lyase [bacterium]|nr:bifunctional DNA-formamidopyrimidine glycosylase/DNA-(apurinic or apyrimidinic site) lyase [bacterium]